MQFICLRWAIHLDNKTDGEDDGLATGYEDIKRFVCNRIDVTIILLSHHNSQKMFTDLPCGQSCYHQGNAYGLFQLDDVETMTAEAMFSLATRSILHQFHASLLLVRECHGDDPVPMLV